MDGYSVTEAASVLGVPTERVWELLARGVLSGHPEGETGMRVFLQPRPGPSTTSPIPERPRNGNGGPAEPGGELSPFRELLTEFRNLTERYGQALLALGEARGEVASLRSRVDVLEARMDLRLPTSAPAPSWPMGPIPTARPRESDEVGPRRAELADEVVAEEAPRRRRRSGRPDVADIAEALARADDPSRPELPEVRPAAADAPGAEAEPPGPASAEPELVTAEPDAPIETEVAPAAAAPIEADIAVQSEPVTAEPEAPIEAAIATEPEPEPVATEPEPVAAEREVPTEAPAVPSADGETAADLVEAAAPDLPAAPFDEPAPSEESLQADGDWPAAAPTIDVADLVDLGQRVAETAHADADHMADQVAMGEPAPGSDSAAKPETTSASIAPEPMIGPDHTAGDFEVLAPSEPMDAVEEAEIEPRADQTEEAAAWPEPTRESFTTEPDEGSPYQAALEEPDWLSEEDMGTPSAGTDERWGSADSPRGAAPSAWSLWDAEPAPAEAAPESVASSEAEPVSADAAELVPAAPQVGTERSDEEAVLRLGEPTEADADAASVEDADDAAAEMEVAATGWHSADREGATGPRREWRAIELPGGRELDDALAALRRKARGGSGADEPEAASAEPQETPTDTAATEDRPSDAGAAQRAYARLRRILPH